MLVGRSVPFVQDVFSELKTHLDLCLQKHVGIPSVETIKEKLPADSEIKKDVNELKKVLQGMSEEEQKSYLYEKGNGSRCTLCDKSFKRLKTHLGSCIQKHFALLYTTDDSIDTRSKDRGRTERQKDKPGEADNGKKDPKVETGAFTDSQNEIRGGTQSHTEEKDMKFPTEEKYMTTISSNSTRSIDKDRGSLKRQHKVSRDPGDEQECQQGFSKGKGITDIVISAKECVDSSLAKWSLERKNTEIAHLHDILQKTPLCMDEIKDTAKAMQFTKELKDYLNINFCEDFKWEILNSGSYYEKTKVRFFIFIVYIQLTGLIVFDKQHTKKIFLY